MAGSCYKCGNVLCFELHGGAIAKAGSFFYNGSTSYSSYAIKEILLLQQDRFWLGQDTRKELFISVYARKCEFIMYVCSRKINVYLSDLPKAMFGKIKFQDTQWRDMQFFAFNATISTAKGNLWSEFRKSSLSLMVYLRKSSKSCTTRGLQLVADL